MDGETDSAKIVRCEECGKPVPPDRWGRVGRFHKECRGAWRSERMKGNRHGEANAKPVPWHDHPADELKTTAYQGTDAAMIRRVTTSYWGEVAQFAYWAYDLLNPRCYEGKVAHPLFQFCRVMPYGKCIGQAYTGDVDRPVIDVFWSLWYDPHPYLAVFEVIAHELMHFWVSLAWREAGTVERWRTSHNNSLWYAGVHRASQLLHVDLGLLDEPYEHWPGAGWTADQCARLNKALQRRKFPRSL
jgi:hypothetical protein